MSYWPTFLFSYVVPVYISRLCWHYRTKLDIVQFLSVLRKCQYKTGIIYSLNVWQNLKKTFGLEFFCENVFLINNSFSFIVKGDLQSHFNCCLKFALINYTFSTFIQFCLHFQIYCHKLVLSLYLASLKVCRICSHGSFFISDISYVCLFFLYHSLQFLNINQSFQRATLSLLILLIVLFHTKNFCSFFLIFCIFCCF